MLTLPAWAVGVLVSILGAVMGFAWRLAEKASRSADKLEAAVEKLNALESRIAVIAALERSIAVMERDHQHLAEKVSVHHVEMERLRDTVHAILRREQGSAT